MAYVRLMFMSNDRRLFLRKHVNLLGLRVQPKSSFTPMGGWMGDLFKLKTILKNWETIPIFITLAINLAIPVVHSVLHFQNSNDIRYWPGTKMKCQKHRWILEGPPEPTVYLVMQQKWEWPQGLLDALREPTENENENESDDDEDNEDRCWCYKSKDDSHRSSDSRPKCTRRE